jgi:hypothetical protein
MRINYRELLVFVAIVTSALVMQVRQHMTQTPGAPSIQRETCDPAAESRSAGLLRATCDTPRHRQPIDGRGALPRVRLVA